MTPTSRSLAVVLLCLALAVPLALGVLTWRSSSGRPRVRRLLGAVGIVGAVLAGQVALLASAGVEINRTLGLYPTWGDVRALAEGPADAGALIPDASPVSLTGGQADAIRQRGWALLRDQPHRGNGQYRLYLVPSGTKAQRVIVWVPPGYEKATSLAGLRTVYLYGGAYVSVDWFVGAARPGDTAGPLIAAKKLPPFAIVAPEINITAPGDAECTDYPGNGPQAYSWLARAVPDWAHRVLGLPQDAAHVSAVGWSLGGYCAAKVHAASPTLVGAAASLQGYFLVENDTTTGTLTADLAKDPALRSSADVGWLLARPGHPTPHLLVVTSTVDPQSYPQSSRFLAAWAHRPGIWSAIYPDAGHTVTSWRGIQPDLWTFLVARTPWPQRLARP